MPWPFGPVTATDDNPSIDRSVPADGVFGEPHSEVALAAVAVPYDSPETAAAPAVTVASAEMNRTPGWLASWEMSSRWSRTVIAPTSGWSDLIVSPCAWSAWRIC